MKMMNILLLGNGGREHALAWKIKQSTFCKELFIAPGNGGTQLVGTNLSVAVTDFDAIKEEVLNKNIDMVVVGPEEPLVKGVTDFLANDAATAHVKIIGPSKAAAQLEGSKAFAKGFMQRHQIPTASYREFTADNYDEGAAFIKQQPIPIVLKADGLAAGKGVIICNSHIEALAEFELMIMQSKFGDAGKKVVVEQFLKGIEISVFVLTDGNDYVLLPEAKDYKRINIGDTGLNTGGMGAVSPVPFFDDILKQKVIQRIIDPTIEGLIKEKLQYTGFIFFGLMITEGEPMVIEYNCRLGDPETETILPRLKSDLLLLLNAATENKLANLSIEINRLCAATVIAVSGGYPGQYKKGLPISGLETVNTSETMIFHAGTALENNMVVTNGGRVLAATSLGDTIREASEISTYNLEQIYFENCYFRSDIGYEFYTEL